ncbi:hypothetical protein Bca101_070572 [Brassica carinata]
MMFTAGEEPIGVHVLTYQSSCAIKKIVNALEDEEVGVIRVINTVGCSVSEKNLIDIAERARPLTAKAVDIFSRILRVVQNKIKTVERQRKDESFDTKVPASLSRNYTKFAKNKRKQAQVFPKGLADFLENLKDFIRNIRRFYPPFNFDR